MESSIIAHKPYLSLSVACVLCYLNSLGCGFVFDDVSAIKDNKDLLPSTPISNLFNNDFWGIPMYKEQSHKSYRPLCVLSFRLNYFIHGLDPCGYHLLNVILHLMVTLLFHNVSRNYVNAKTSFFAAMIFAVHPVHTEAVTGVVGRAELLSAIFFLITLKEYNLCYDRSPWHLLLACGSSCLAMLSKEVGVTVIGLCIVSELFVKQNIHKQFLKLLNSKKSMELKMDKGLLFRLLLLLMTLALLLIFRIQKLQGASLPVFTKFDNPASHAEGLSKLLTYSYLPCLNLWILLCPTQLCCDWTMGSIPLLQSISDPRIIAIITFTSITILFTLKILLAEEKHSKQILLSSAWIIIPFLPASNIFFPVGFVIAERVLYIPSMGLCLLVSLGYQKIIKQCKSVNKSFQILFYLFLISQSIKTMTRNLDWSDEKSIFLSGLTVNKNNAKLYNNVGHAFESQKNYNEALLFFKEAVNVQPNDIGAHINIGRTLNHLEMFDEAEVAYRSAQKLLPRASPGQKLITRIAPNSLNLFLNLGNLVARNSSRLEEADNLYKQAIAMRADYVQAYINRGDVLLRMNKTEEALNIYKEALKYDNNNADIHYNLAVVALEQQKPEVGMNYLNKALEINPLHPEALLNSAIVIQELGLEANKRLVVERLLKLKEMQPDNERVFFNLGMLATDEENIFEAELWFRQAIQLKPNFRSALFNLALLLVDSHRPEDALVHLDQLLLHFPAHIKGLILMGDILTNHKKDFDKAESLYKRILSLDPDHVQAQHNLCVVFVERGELKMAKSCLEKTLSLAPSEKYIRNHLNIVNKKLNSKYKSKQ